MNIIIVEDEILAAERLEELLKAYDGSIAVLARPDSVTETVNWIKQNGQKLDLAFFDIQLSDGLSFEIFEQVNVSCPVIFTTAFDQYAIKAFHTNGIDYLLKPISLEDLKKAFEKYENLAASFQTSNDLDWRMLQQLLKSKKRSPYKSRFIVKSGVRFFAITVDQVHLFFSENKLVWLLNKEGKKYVLDQTLDQLEALLDPELFFRINRKCIVRFDGIQEVTTYSGKRLKVKVTAFKEEIVVSRERVGAFKAWLDGEGG